MLPTYIAVLNELIDVFVHSFSKEVSSLRERFLFMPACLCKLWELTRMAKGKDLGIMRASNDVSASCIILKSISSFMENLVLTEGMGSVLCMHLQ